MPRPRTLFTGQWADLPLEQVASMAADMGYDGLELACWGDHFDVAQAAGSGSAAYCKGRREILESHGLNCWAISNHLVGQCVCDLIDTRHKSIIAARVWGDGDPEGVRKRAAEEMKQTARAAAAMDVKIVNGFTGSSIWHKLYFFPPTSQQEIQLGYQDFGTRWLPILDEFGKAGVRFALEVHPTEIAYDIFTAVPTLVAVEYHESFGFNFDPSHLIWQGVDPAKFVDAHADRIFHVHIKDAARRLDGMTSILGSHLPFGHVNRGWDFRSPGRGEIDFESIIRALNRANYQGPLSVEWEDPGMDRVHGAREAAAFVETLDFDPPGRAFDAAFERK